MIDLACIHLQMMLLHGEQFLELHQQIPVSASLKIESKVVEVSKKKNAALLVIGVTLRNAATHTKVSYGEASIFLRGASPRADTPGT